MSIRCWPRSKRMRRATASDEGRVIPYYQDDAVQIFHGDCRELLPRLRGPATFVVTDPPYNAGKKYGAGTNDRREWPDWVAWLDGLFDIWAAAVPETLMFLSQTAYRHYIRLSSRDVDWSAIWYKPLSLAICAAPFMPHYEHIVYFGDRKKCRHHHSNGQFERHGGCSFGSDVLTANVEYGQNRWGHPTPKPLLLMRDIISRLDEDAVILDPFMGSGTTLRAAKDLGRKAIGIEIEERYCEIAAKRMSQAVLPL